MTGEKVCLLYIGDDDQLLRALTRDEQMTVTVMQNGILALKWLTGGHFNPFNRGKPFELPAQIRCQAILCEGNLPGMSGMDLYMELKSHLNLDSTPFILISGSINSALRQQALALGIDDCYCKPLDATRFRFRLEYLLEYKHKMLQAQNLENNSVVTLYKTPLPKRLFDLVFASLALVLLAPLFLVVMLAIRLDSPGPVIYAAKRVGANFRIFNFFKFRTMYTDADARIKELEHLNQYAAEQIEQRCSICAKLPSGEFCSTVVYYDDERICERMAIIRRNSKKAFLKISNDPRITPVGKFLRNTSLDELPQLINIIKGDMSIVGNRPLPLQEANAITKSKYARRFHAAAGLTGLWQVEMRGKGGIMSEDERFNLDNHYAAHNTFWQDLKLVLFTLPAIMQKENV